MIVDRVMGGAARCTMACRWVRLFAVRVGMMAYDPVVVRGDVRGGSELTLVVAVVVYARSVGSVCDTDNGD